MTAQQVEVRTVERAIRCADGQTHYGENHLAVAPSPAYLITVADNDGRRTANGWVDCGPHAYWQREQIVTAWTEVPL